MLHIGRGARAVEAWLLDDLTQLVDEAIAEPALLRLPVRVVLPSRSLREHVGAAIVRRAGRALAGVKLQSLRGLALEAVERAGWRAPRGDRFFSVVVRQQARREPVLRAALDDLDDGYSAVVADVADLLDAGFLPEHADAVDELLGEEGLAAPLAERARAVVRVAAETARLMDGLGLGRSASLLRLARESVERDPEHALPGRAILIHGFADATGVATDLIEALVRHCGARLYLDEPPDPAALAQPDLGVSFSQRFASRLAHATAVARSPREPPSPPQISLLEAPGAHAEIRAIAERAGALLGAGCPPEQIGVVARDLTQYVVPIRQHFARLGIPFSSPSAEAPGGGARRAIAILLELLSRGRDCAAEQWLAARSRPTGWGARAAVRGTLREAGVARLGDLEEVDPGDGNLGRLAADAAALLARLSAWPERASLARHLDEVRALLRDDLGWTGGLPGTSVSPAEVLAVLDEIESEAPAALAIDRVELVSILDRALGAIGAAPLGGEGGGVQVLNVIEARARTFAHLFVAGMNRDVFPRNVTEDPIIPDAVRIRMLALLPDLPIKARGFDEERYLFAQLLSSSPRVTLSWQSMDDDGRAGAPSPLLERIRLAGVAAASTLVGSLHAAAPDPGDAASVGPRPAHERALLAGLYGSRAQWQSVLPIAIAEVSRALPPGRDVKYAPAAAERMASARGLVLAELDPDRRTREGALRARQLGPYFGFVGPARRQDTGAAPLTVLEGTAACPWQSFVERRLGVGPLADPLEELPATTRRLVGETVHAALERIVTAAGHGEAAPELDLARARSLPPIEVAWPADDDLRRIVATAARQALEKEGLRFRGLDQVLARQVLPYLLEARAVDWPVTGGTVAVVGVEIEGALVLRDEHDVGRTVRFRADRVDALPDGLRLTDYKTGAALPERKQEGSRRSQILRRIARGERLQAFAYALGAGGELDEGRFLFLRPGIPESTREVSVRANDAELRRAFEDALRAVLHACDEGVFFPRLVDAEKLLEPHRCEHCPVAEACLRGDSGARARFVRWAEAFRDGRDAAPESLQAMDRLWRLGTKASAAERDAGEEA
ncbi:MAG TPA: PD-(D/E)XK nuclease family protein [Candidatus Bathyarchaeia archaeon]|nr:PD-(D/E)XK nuclease family protein [Candidatus Bathyarchaeia archaeon]